MSKLQVYLNILFLSNIYTICVKCINYLTDIKKNLSLQKLQKYATHWNKKDGTIIYIKLRHLFTKKLYFGFFNKYIYIYIYIYIYDQWR